MSTVAIEKAQESRARRAKTVKAIGGLFVSAVAPAVGIAAGVWFGIHSAHQAPERIAEAKSELASAETKRVDDKQAFDTYMGALPKSCQSVLSAYLSGGANESFSLPDAQLSVQKTEACPATAVTAVADSRSLEHTYLVTDESAVHDKEQDLHYAKTNAEQHNQIALGAEAAFIGGFASFAGAYMGRGAVRIVRGH